MLTWAMNMLRGPRPATILLQPWSLDVKERIRKDKLRMEEDTSTVPATRDSVSLA